MATDKYELEEVAYGTAGWNGILTTNHQKVDDNLHTRLLVTLGEAASVSDALYLSTDGKWYKAVAGQPSQGLAIEAGILDDEIRLQRVGPYTDGSWTWTVGLPLWVDPTTPGALTHNKPVSSAQLMGFAHTTTTVILNPQFPMELFDGTTTTTSTTTTTT